jgi:hypothetical protein
MYEYILQINASRAETFGAKVDIANILFNLKI